MYTYAQDIKDAVEAKLIELDGIKFGGATGRRFELSGVGADGKTLTEEQRRENRRIVLTDIAERLGLHFFQMTDAVMLDQLIALSVVHNHDTAGLLKSLINSFLIAYTNKDTSLPAYQLLQGLEFMRAMIEKDPFQTRH